MSRTLKLTIAYDGTDFLGWQIQPQGRTVQSELQRATEELTGEEVNILASGRTDTGVHALGQVVSLRTESQYPAEVFVNALNARLPEDVTVLSAEDVSKDFHPIRDCLTKRYRYVWRDGSSRDVFSRRFAWQVHQRLDDIAMHRAAEQLLGKHDFAAYQSTGAPRKSTIRTVTELSVRRGNPLALFAPASLSQDADSDKGRSESKDFVVMEIAADGFLYNMVRAIAGTLVEVGLGKQPEAWPFQVLESRDRAQAGATAPPQGLFLVAAEYAPV